MLIIILFLFTTKLVTIHVLCGPTVLYEMTLSSTSCTQSL